MDQGLSAVGRRCARWRLALELYFDSVLVLEPVFESDDAAEAYQQERPYLADFEPMTEEEVKEFGCVYYVIKSNVVVRDGESRRRP